MEQKWAAYQASDGWLKDTCAGGVFSWNVDDAIWFDSPADIVAALDGGEIVGNSIMFIRMK